VSIEAREAAAFFVDMAPALLSACVVCLLGYGALVACRRLL